MKERREKGRRERRNGGRMTHIHGPKNLRLWKQILGLK